MAKEMMELAKNEILNMANGSFFGRELSNRREQIMILLS